MIQKQKEETARRTKLDDKNFGYVLLGVSEESKAKRLYDIEAADENSADENISSGSLAEASSPTLNKARNRRPPVWMRDYAIGEDFCKEDDEAHSVMFTKLRSWLKEGRNAHFATFSSLFYNYNIHDFI